MELWQIVLLCVLLVPPALTLIAALEIACIAYLRDAIEFAKENFGKKKGT